ncbi:aldo/keto reductase [Hoeflea poritis]|uniref:Aldo/keto reductase n=1 Tax=Hoeflea poritis TaxID=2993659 RepID=A0ABT4VJZ7_9HYPH|nr:aldo/keto reductase [Hoeflea poritis]MDA4845043.1 aldo/keto reductase [Hoeflea poritis]
MKSPVFPEFGLGCAHLGNLFTTVEEPVAAATLWAAWDAGVRYFDTAPWYGHGLSELRLGGLLRHHPREDFFLSTKVGRVYDSSQTGMEHIAPWTGGLPYAMHYDYTAHGFAASLAQSRLRLGVPRIDALVIHDLDTGHHGDGRAAHAEDLVESGLPYLHDLKRRGEISAIGMGTNATEDFAHFAPMVDVDFFIVAMPYTLLDQAALTGPMQTCIERGIKVVIGAPFASGLLADPGAAQATYGYAAAGEDIRAKALAIEAVCERHGVPIAAAALRFPLLHPAVTSVIPGAVSPEQVRQNVEHMSRSIPDALWERLKADGLILDQSPTENAPGEPQ